MARVVTVIRAPQYKEVYRLGWRAGFVGLVGWGALLARVLTVMRAQTLALWLASLSGWHVARAWLARVLIVHSPNGYKGASLGPI